MSITTKRRLFLRFLALLMGAVVMLFGIHAITDQILHPKTLKVNGQRVAMQDVMDAYYQMNPEVSKQLKVTRQNAIEAFLLRQKLYQEYLERTEGRWLEGIVIGHQEAYTTTDQDARMIPVRRYFLAVGEEVFCVYTQNMAWRFSVHSRVRVKLGGEFKTLGEAYKVVYQGKTTEVRFSSIMLEASVLGVQALPPKPKLAPHKSKRR